MRVGSLVAALIVAGLTACGDASRGDGVAPVDAARDDVGAAHPADGAPEPPARGADAALADLLARPAPAFLWDGESGAVRGLHLAGERFGGRPTRAFALYATPGGLVDAPDAPASLPAVLLLHGGGGRAEAAWVEEWAARGYAALAPDLAGRGRDGERLPDGGPDQTPLDRFGRLDAPVTEHWHWHAYANALAGLAWLRARAEVDPARVAVVGTSWGGALACTLSALDERLAAAVSVYGCGLLAEGGFLEHTFALLPPGWTARWTALYDPATFLPEARAPLLLVDGTNDPIFPLDILLRSHALAPRAALLLVPGLEHGHLQARQVPEVVRFVDAALRGEPALAVLFAPRTDVDGERLADGRSDARARPASAVLVESHGDAALGERAWSEVPATVDDLGDGRFRVRAPPASVGVTLWFVTVTDVLGGRASSTLAGPAAPALLGDG